MYQLKRLPEDFVVREVMPLSPNPKGKFAYALLRKKNWSTPDALTAIAKALDLPRDKVKAAGMKDRSGISEQYVSVLGARKEQLEKLDIRDLKLAFVGYGDEPLGLAQHEANAFEIVVRNLDKPLKLISWLCNYYDSQRFGGIRQNTHLIGEALLKRDFEGAMRLLLTGVYPSEPKGHAAARKYLSRKWGKWFVSDIPVVLRTERAVVKHLLDNPGDYPGAFWQIPRQISTLYIHAYQSFLFNEILAAYVAKIGKEAWSKGITGELPLVDRELPAKIPLVGYDYDPKKDQVAEITRTILEKHRLNPRIFEFGELPFLSSRTIYRPATIKLNLKLSDSQEDMLNPGKLMQTVSFTLPKGSYATLVIEAMYRLSKKEQ